MLEAATAGLPVVAHDGRVGTETNFLALPDGRQVCYALVGDPRGYPVIGLHGTPGCRLDESWPDSVYADAGVCYVSPDRAGHGRSSRRPGRRVADEAADVLALADALGFGRFVVTGASGGGAPALACAALLAERVERAACQVGLAPLGEGGLSRSDWLAGMSKDNVEEIRWAEAGEDVLATNLARKQETFMQQLASDPAGIMGVELSEADRAFLARPEIIASLRRSVPEMAVHGVGGWVDDTLAGIAPWGFDPRTITIPVLVTYGLTDVLVPSAHGVWLSANIPTAVTVVSQQGGHMPVDRDTEITETMAWLRDGTVPPGAGN